MIDPKKNNNNHIVEDINNDNNEEDLDKVASSFELKQKMKRLIMLIIILTALLLIIMWLLSLRNPTNKSYADLEKIMVNAAQNYYKDNKNLLPKKNKGINEVSLQKLINLEYMRELEKYGSNKLKCSGKVVVENNDDDYVYVPYLDCSSDYKTTELFRKVSNSSNVVTSGNGLYHINGEFVFRGDNVNNYVKLDDKLWRIVKIDNNDEVVLILNDTYDMSMAWDDRYNSIQKFKVGFNDYKISRIYDTLNNIYSASKTGDDSKFTNLLVSKKTLKYLTSYNLCYGKRGTEQAVNNNSLECSQVLTAKIGLLTLSDYINASLDGVCSKVTDKSCQNYNYLTSINNDWWLLTGNSANDYEVYYVAASGVIKKQMASSYFGIRPVIHLNSKTMFKSGNGTESKPYKIK